MLNKTFGEALASDLGNGLMQILAIALIIALLLFAILFFIGFLISGYLIKQMKTGFYTSFLGLSSAFFFHFSYFLF